MKYIAPEGGFSVETLESGFQKIQTSYVTEGFGPVAVSEKSSGTIIGVAGIRRADGGELELGCSWFKPYWGQGYAFEACSRVLQYAFRVREFEEIHARTQIGNTTSRQGMEKYGFQVVGVELIRGKSNKVLVMRRADFLARQGSSPRY